MATAGFGGGVATLVAGPRTLSSVLATRLGLTHPPVQHSTRIAQYRAIIAHVGDAWSAASFELDPWNTAAHLLELRDEAVAAGWLSTESRGRDAMPDAEQFPRLHALWSLEQSVNLGFPGQKGANLAPGPADDLTEIRHALEDRTLEGHTWPLGIDSIDCSEDPSRLPAQWPRVFELLRAGGVQVTVSEPAPHPAPSFRLVRAPHEVTAAEVAARLIRSEVDDATHGENLTILASSDSIALDAQLARRSLPPVSHVPASTHRLAMQVLPLFLDTLTPHLDVHALAALLTLELPRAGGGAMHLLPSRASRQLVDALAREAGISNDEESAWHTALLAIDERDTTTDGAASGPVIRDFCALLTPPERDYYAQPVLGAPHSSRIRIAALTPQLDFLDQRLAALAGSARDVVPLIRVHLANLRELLALTSAGQSDPAVPERELADLIRAAAPSQRSLLGHRTPTPWTFVTEPAHVDGGTGSPAGTESETSAGTPAGTEAEKNIGTPAGTGAAKNTVLWWGATDDSTNKPTTWDSAEVEYLRSHGAHVLTSDAVAALETHARLTALSRAERLLAIAPERIDGEATRLSPLVSHLAVRAWTTTHGTDADLGTILSNPEFATDAHTLLREARDRGEVRTVDEQTPSAPTHLARRVTPGTHLLPEYLSFSQLTTLITDTTGWLLRHPFGITPGGSASVPTGARMIGNLLHAVLEELVRRHRLADGHVSTQSLLEAIAAGEVEGVLNELIPRHASELALPGNKASHHEVAETARRSIEHFFTVLRDAGIAVRAIEHPISGATLPLTVRTPTGTTETAVRFGGSIDFLGEDQHGNPVVLDFKWTRGEKHYRERVASGTALQLATYTWALSAGGGGSAELSGYFLLRQGEFVSAHRELGARHHGNAPTTTEVFTRAITSAEHALGTLARGEVRTETGQNAVMHRHPQLDMKPRDLIALRRRTHERRGRYFEDAKASYSDYTLLTGVEGDFS